MCRPDAQQGWPRLGLLGPVAGAGSPACLPATAAHNWHVLCVLQIFKFAAQDDDYWKDYPRPSGRFRSRCYSVSGLDMLAAHAASTETTTLCVSHLPGTILPHLQGVNASAGLAMCVSMTAVHLVSKLLALVET